jgi:NAD-dependent dihydropyrimidine dehydrogenase PreA subunit
MAANVNNEKCSGCGVCVDACAVGAIALENDKANVSDECIDCGVCTDECPNEAISLP